MFVQLLNYLFVKVILVAWMGLEINLGAAARATAAFGGQQMASITRVSRRPHLYIQCVLKIIASFPCDLNKKPCISYSTLA